MTKLKKKAVPNARSAADMPLVRMSFDMLREADGGGIVVYVAPAHEAEPEGPICQLDACAGCIGDLLEGPCLQDAVDGRGRVLIRFVDLESFNTYLVWYAARHKRGGFHAHAH